MEHGVRRCASSPQQLQRRQRRKDLSPLFSTQSRETATDVKNETDSRQHRWGETEHSLSPVGAARSRREQITVAFQAFQARRNQLSFWFLFFARVVGYKWQSKVAAVEKYRLKDSGRSYFFISLFSSCGISSESRLMLRGLADLHISYSYRVCSETVRALQYPAWFHVHIQPDIWFSVAAMPRLQVTWTLISCTSGNSTSSCCFNYARKCIITIVLNSVILYEVWV